MPPKTSRMKAEQKTRDAKAAKRDLLLKADIIKNKDAECQNDEKSQDEFIHKSNSTDVVLSTYLSGMTTKHLGLC